MANVGDYLTIKGVKKRWAGKNYGWQTPATYSQLEKQGKFKVGAQFLDRLGQYLGPAIQQVQGFQQQVRRATPFLDPVENVVNRAVVADDKLPSSRVASGGAVAAQRAGNALNIDPRLAGIGGLLIGGVHTSGPKAGTYKWKPTGDLKPHVDVIENAIENAHQHFNKTGSLKGVNTLIELPNGQALRISNKGSVNFDRRTGLSPVATTSKPKPTAKPNVSTAVQDIAASKAIATSIYNVPTNMVDDAIKHLSVDSILSPAYVAKVEQLVNQSTIHWDKLKGLTRTSSKGKVEPVIRPGRSLNMLMAEPSPVAWDKLKDLDLDNFDDLVQAYKNLDNVFAPMSSQEMFGRQYIEGHHPVQVESVAKASKHLSVPERLRFLDILAKDYTYGGNNAKDMFGLSKPGHVGKMSGLINGKQPLNAHQSIMNDDLVKPGFVGREGDNWAQIDFTGYKDADSLAKAFWQQSGEPQMRIAEIVFDSPAESTIRQGLADSYGIRERDLYSPTGDKTRGDKLKKKLDGASVLKIIQDAYQQHYGP